MLAGRHLSFGLVELLSEFYPAIYPRFLPKSDFRKSFSDKHLQIGVAGFEPTTF